MEKEASKGVVTSDGCEGVFEEAELGRCAFELVFEGLLSWFGCDWEVVLFLELVDGSSYVEKG